MEQEICQSEALSFGNAALMDDAGQRKVIATALASALSFSLQLTSQMYQKVLHVVSTSLSAFSRCNAPVQGTISLNKSIINQLRTEISVGW